MYGERKGKVCFSRIPRATFLMYTTWHITATYICTSPARGRFNAFTYPTLAATRHGAPFRHSLSATYQTLGCVCFCVFLLFGLLPVNYVDFTTFMPYGGPNPHENVIVKSLPGTPTSLVGLY